MTRRKSKTRFTREAHFELGLKLAHIQATLDDAVVRASHVYPIASRECAPWSERAALSSTCAR